MEHNIKKRLAAVIMAAALAAVLSACSKSGEETMPAPDAASQTRPAVSAADASGSDAAVSSADLWYDGLEGEELSIAGMIISSTDAFNAEDVETYMSFIAPDSPGRESTRGDTAELFDNYQLIASVDDVVFNSVDARNNTATVTVTQTTVRDGTEGKGFAPVQNVLEHHLVKRDGQWKYNSTTVLSRRELTDRWKLFIDFASNPPASSADAPEASEES